jgi:hypothetical protein
MGINMIYKEKICKYCNKKFTDIEGKVFSNHVRWCDKNPIQKDRINGFTEKGLLELRGSLSERYGIKKPIEKKCIWCGKVFIIYRNNKPIKREKKCCSKTCTAKYSASFVVLSNESKLKISESMKNVWKNPEYFNNMANKNININKMFTSKGEREVREYFKENFPEDKWTFGGGLIFNEVRLVRDLYSNKLKVCIEYDGIWHFKNIHGQLKDKQHKDKMLKKWCENNGFRLIRIKDELYQQDKEKYLNELIGSVYNSLQPYIEIY